MHRKRWNPTIVLFGLVLLLPGSCAVSLGDKGDGRLRKRIEELEAENRSLCRILAGIQSALASVPKSTIPTPAGPNGVRIIVVPGDWGGSQLTDIRKVCESAAGTIAALHAGVSAPREPRPPGLKRPLVLEPVMLET